MKRALARALAAGLLGAASLRPARWLDPDRRRDQPAVADHVASAIRPRTSRARSRS
jgi:hypothetical protein